MTDTAIKTSTWNIDTAHSVLEFSVKHMMFTTAKGRFEDFGGTFTYDPQNVANSSVEVTINTASITTNTADRDAHLRSADFFDAEKYPNITFKSTKVEAARDKKLRVFGDLTIKGVTKPVVLDTTINKIGEQPMAKRAAAGFDATTTIKRSDFGVDKYAPNVSDNVTIRITTEAVVAAK